MIGGRVMPERFEIPLEKVLEQARASGWRRIGGKTVLNAGRESLMPSSFGFGPSGRAAAALAFNRQGMHTLIALA